MKTRWTGLLATIGTACTGAVLAMRAEMPPAPYASTDRELSRRIAASHGEERDALLDERWSLVQRAVAHYRATEHAFHQSVTFWTSGWMRTGGWSLEIDGELGAEPHAMPDLPPRPSVLVRGDCNEDLTIHDGGIVHVTGDLRSTLEFLGEKGHPELVIAGDVSAGARIELEGIARVLVGGDLHGEVWSTGSLDIWILGDMTGSVETGAPRTRLGVGGNLEGTVEPAEDAALLSLEVRGHAASALLRSIGKQGYTEFMGSVGSSDVEPGLYGHRQSVYVVHGKR